MADVAKIAIEVKLAGEEGVRGGVRGIGDSARSAAGDVGGLTAKFTKLAAAVVAMVGSYASLQGAMEYVRKGFDFSAEMETSKIGIASLITATSTLSDSQGRILKGQEAYSAALGVSEEIMNRVRIMGLETTATTQDLVAGFQAMLAPATAVGFSMEQTQNFALSMVKALGAMGIPLNQLSAEGRSLLDGTIIPTQDRLATALGISNDMVKSWKEQGRLAEELSARLGAFELAGEDVASAWAGLSSNMDDALGVLSGYTGEGYFAGVKSAYKELLGFLVDTKEARPGEDIRNIAETVRDLQTKLGEFVAGAAQGFMGFLRGLNQPESIATLRAIGSAMLTVASYADEAAVALVAYTAAKRVAAAATAVATSEELRYQMALARMAGVTQAAGVAQTVFTRLRIAMGGVVAMLGGPWVAGFTLAATAAYGLYSHFKSNNDALDKLKGQFSGAAGEAGAFAVELAKADAAMLRVMQTAAIRNVDGAKDVLGVARREVEKVLRDTTSSSTSYGAMGASGGDFIRLAKAEYGAVNQVMAEYKAETIDAVAAMDKLNALRQRFGADNKVVEGAADALAIMVQATKNLTDEQERAAQIDKRIATPKDTPIITGGVGGANDFSGMAGKVDTARQYLADLRNEIALLSGTANSFDVDLQKKLAEIAKHAQAAGLQMSELEAVQASYSDARNAQRLKSLNDAYRDIEITMAQMRGDGATVQKLELESAVESLRTKLTELKAPAEEAEAKIRAFVAASKEKVNTDNLQEKLNFLKDFAKLSGDYGLGMDTQNKLIEEQARNLRAAYPELTTYITQWELLQKLEVSHDPLAGLFRGLRKWTEDASNMAKGLEDAITGAFDGAADAVAEFVRTGKLDFKSFADSVIQGMLRIAARQALSGLAGGLMGMIGNIFGGSSGTYPVGALVGTNVSVFHAGGMVGPGAPSYAPALPMRAFADAPRWHGGYPGFGPDEYPAVLLRGERVLNQDETRGYNAALGMGAMPSAAPMPALPVGFGGGAQILFSPIINPVVINSTGQDVEVETKTTSNGNGNFDLEIFITKTVDTGLSKLAASGKSQLMNYIDKSRGTGGNARSLY